MASMLSEIVRNSGGGRRGGSTSVEIGTPYRMGVEIGEPEIELEPMAFEIGSRPEQRKPQLVVSIGTPEIGEPDPEPPAQAERPQQQRKKQRQRQARWSDPKFLEDVGSRLAAKAYRGHGVAAPSLVPMAQLPRQYTDAIQGDDPNTPIQGWDPRSLEPDEAELLFRLMAANQRQQQPQEQMPPLPPAPNGGV